MRLTPLLGALLLPACGLMPAETEDKLARSVEKIVDRKDEVHHAVLHVSSSQLDIDGTWAFGDAQSGEAMTADTPFVSASIGKLFTATAVLALADEGALSLDDDLTVWLEDDLLEDLPVKGSADEVTLRMLLSHHSGLPDYFVDETHDGTPNVMTLITTEPNRSWTPESLLQYTGRHFDPVGNPGELFHYADTNYDLLGLVIESATDLPFHEAVRALVLEPLALTSTWYYNLEPAPAEVPTPADPWFEETNIAGVPALSLDWAGGGLMTTTADLAAFLRGLEAGTPVALERFQESWTTDALTDGVDYGYGLWRVRPDGLSRWLSSPEMIGVSGFTGSYLYLVPETDTLITGTFDQSLYAEEHIIYLVTKVLPLLDRTLTPE